MIIIEIIGGLGNQMFQYAYAKSLQQKGYQVKIDISAFINYKLHGGYQLDKYQIDLPKASATELKKYAKAKGLTKLANYLLPKKHTHHIYASNFSFDEALLEPEDGTYIHGYFQSPRYFSSIKNIIAGQFTLKHTLSPYAIEIANQIAHSSIAVSLHVRRGDYITDNNAAKVHGTCDIRYYQKAVQKITETSKNSTIFVFSDDILWAKQHLDTDNTYFIESIDNRPPHEDMYLMSQCHHNIIANSSYSWWGAWLNPNPNKKVIAPKQWFLDQQLQEHSSNLIPACWLRI